MHTAMQFYFMAGSMYKFCIFKSKTTEYISVRNGIFNGFFLFNFAGCSIWKLDENDSTKEFIICAGE